MPSLSISELTATHLKRLCFLYLFALGLAGCAGVKNYPKGRPFAYNNTIKLSASPLDKEKSKILEGNLLNYLDDSLTVRTRSILGFTQRLRPPAFDSATLASSSLFINGFLQREGFYRCNVDTVIVKYDTVIKKGKPQYRVSTTFYITVGTFTKIDTVVYSFQHPVMQQLAQESLKKSQLRKGAIYTEQSVGLDLDRLSSQFRQNGFFRVTKNVLLAEVDSTDESLVSFDLDPVQAQVLAQKRRDSPSVKIRIMQRPGLPEAFFRQYTVDSVLIYPETNIRDNVDSLIADTTFSLLARKGSARDDSTGFNRRNLRRYNGGLPDSLRTRRGNPYLIFIKQKEGLFQEQILRRNNYMLPGRLYNEQQYFRTLNSYSQMGPWQQADVRTFMHHKDSSSSVSFHYFLYPAKRQSFQFDLEGSQNNSVSGSLLTSQFFALSLLGTHRHKNMLKQGIQSTTTARVGFELNNSKSSGNAGLFQTFITGLSQSFALPRLLWPVSYLDSRKLDARRTTLNFGAYYADRFQFYKQTSLNANLNWEIRRGKHSFAFALPLFESVNVIASDSLRKLIIQNPSLLFSFNPGHTLGFRGRYERAFDYHGSTRHSSLLRTAAEVGLPWQFTIFDAEFYQYIKTEAQFIHQIKNYRSSWHGRFLIGIGWETDGPREATLPFFKQFVTGGNMNMRAWSLRQLGLGNSLTADTSTIYTDRFADIQGEINIEYRFKISRLLGFDLNGAAFTDIGNIWSHYPQQDGLGEFRLKYLYRDLAIATGVGIRWDFSYLVIRLDAGFKLKDPVRAGNGWIDGFEWKSTNRLGTNERSNVALQFGIGYPF